MFKKLKIFGREKTEIPEYVVQINNEIDLMKIVNGAIDSRLKHPIEYRNWIYAFWDESTNSPKKETSIQPTIFEMLKPYLKPYGIEIVKKSDEGIGELDFKCIYNRNSKIMKVHIEFKLAHSQDWKNGLTKQLPAYMDADETKYGIYLVFWFKDGFKDGMNFNEPKNITSIEIMQKELEKEAKKIENKIIEPIVIDVTKKKSASKR